MASTNNNIALAAASSDKKKKVKKSTPILEPTEPQTQPVVSVIPTISETTDKKKKIKKTKTDTVMTPPPPVSVDVPVDVPVDDVPTDVPSDKKKRVKKPKEVQLNPDGTPVEKKKREKTPSLPAKHAKFMQFGAWFIQSLLDSGAINSELNTSLLNHLLVFDSFDNQLAFYTSFANQHKDFNKSLRKLVLANKRAIKLANKPTKSKKSKNSLNDEHSDFLSSILSQDIKTADEPIVAAKQPETESVVVDKEEDDHEEEEEEDAEVNVRPFLFEGNTYLIDDDNNLYDSSTHSLIGTFSNNSVKLL
jgi:hypothetical protein